MERINKFGTFAGVYTPSILTILGVIMYLRLGWIVGQAGILYAVGIILVAHVISVTTGLSLSSIATDKKIKAGGIYYMLSRSLGLPMGGAIGMAIFLATALSIALYLVGFSESFLAVDRIRDFLGLEQTVVSYQLIASVFLLLIVAIALISTSLAIRTQYLVLTAIVLSLVSVFSGLLLHTEFYPSLPSISPHTTSPSIDVLFAIFFPAVTGFTVGVAMSGDLADPRKSIPRGTLFAIFSGMLVYILLAVSFGLFVDRQLLIEDSAFLLKIAAVPFLVITGIWGATLSSALGGVLGGPRIIQALAKDRIAPGLLSKGYGINNEPRIAILVTFFIAQAGIMIGDLNTIARVVSMFFITAYAFINLAFALESWASTDFRPSFKVPRWVGWLGFIASFLVMTQIDFFAMIVAFLLIWLVWYIMKKRHQELEPGDVWQSVWSNITRKSLQNLYAKGIEERNWKPNIILFSDDSELIEPLEELSRTIISSHGLLTVIRLKRSQEEAISLRRVRGQGSGNERELQKGGVFHRDYYCNDPFAGIATVSETYGFAGVEPNTIILDRRKQHSDPIGFVHLISHIMDLDLNLLLIDYDQEKGFGKRKSIDIWWRGAGNNGNLAINLVKFLWLSDRWKDSRLRLLIENPVNRQRERMYDFASEVLDALRMNAEIVIINNEVEKKPYYDLVRIESSDSDLVFLRIPEIEKGKESDFLEKTDRLCHDMGTVVFIRASTQFKSLNVGIRKIPSIPLAMNEKTTSPDQSVGEIKEISLKKMALAEVMTPFIDDCRAMISQMTEESFVKVFYQYQEVVLNARNRVNATFAILEKQILSKNPGIVESDKTIYKLNNNTFVRYEQILDFLANDLLVQQENELSTCFGKFEKTMSERVADLPEFVSVLVSREEILSLPKGTPGRGSLRIGLWINRGKPVTIRVKTRRIASRFYPDILLVIRMKLWQQFSDFSREYLQMQQTVFKDFRDSLHAIENSYREGKLDKQLITKEKQKTEDAFSSLLDLLKSWPKIIAQLALSENDISMKNLTELLNAPHPVKAFNKNPRQFRMKKFELRGLESFAARWKEAQQLHLNAHSLETILSTVEYKLWHFTWRSSYEMKLLLQSGEEKTGKTLSEKVIEFIDHCSYKLSMKQTPDLPAFSIETDRDLERKIKELEDFNQERISAALARIPGSTVLLRSNSETDFTSPRFLFFQKQTIEISRLINYVIHKNLLALFQKELRSFLKQYQQLEQELLEISRLISITLTQDREEPSGLPLESFFEEQRQRAVEVRDKTDSLIILFDDKLQQILNKTTRALSPSLFLKTADNLKLLEKSSNAEAERVSWLNKNAEWVRDFMRRHLVRLWYDRSRRIVYAQQTRAAQEDESFPVSKLHALNEAVAVKGNVLKTTPAYYQQLFLRKNNYFMDFWHGKPLEIEEAGKAIERHRKGYSGAILVKGENNAGKTFFVNYVIHLYLQRNSVFQLHAPFAGSCSINELLKALQKATELEGSARDIFRKLPEQSVVIIEDIELWWEKRPNGLAVIQQICSFVEKYGKSILFILTANSHALRSINRFLPVNSYLLSTIDCSPFNAEEIKNIIMQRHRSGNMKFVFEGKKQEEMRSWDYARLFDRFFTYSRGNVGLSLQTWMGCIDKVEENTLYLRAPHRPDTSVLNKLDSEALIFLVQFILHKRLSFEKIQRIMLLPPEDAKKRLRLLRRAAIITEPNPGVFMLNPNLHAFIRERFIEKELL